MNSAMYRHPTTAKSREALKEMGLQILEPAVGPLACGEEGPGRMIEPEDILKHLENLFGPQTSKMPLNGTNKKILITAGGTREPLDDVRYLTNLSTGFTGENLAHSFAKLGFDVTLNLAASSHVPVSSLYRLERFDTYKSLEELLKYQLSNQDFDFVFHAAAVGDFSVRTAEGKLSSDHDLELVLQKNPKIINSIKHWSKNTNVRLAGFKLTSKLDEASATQKVVQIQSESKADFVIHNDLSTLKNRSEHQFTVFSPQGKTKLVGLDSLSHYFLKILGGPV